VTEPYPPSPSTAARRGWRPTKLDSVDGRILRRPAPVTRQSPPPPLTRSKALICKGDDLGASSRGLTGLDKT